ncbi:RPA-interacting protein [Fopius arisanus]|uniref:RPA-interacting protein n=1 Tax=Fopius arisanus TaxID=64838 RepID=A0A9R1T8Z6_9HYME|nr:PREDICTED: RPA-interacting protein-like [Fopius arisanus]
MANIVGSPQFALKMKTREAVKKIKSGSPKFQEVLRQRCRDRMREKRRVLFDARRAGVFQNNSESIQETLTEIVRQELSDLTTISVDNNTGNSEIFNEPLTEEEIFELEAEMLADEEQWIFQEYEKILENDDEMLKAYVEESLKASVVCPICEKSGLTENPGSFQCPACKLCLPARCSLSQLANTIESQLAAHSRACPGQTLFLTLPENYTLSLYVTCETCQCFSLIL